MLITKDSLVWLCPEGFAWGPAEVAGAAHDRQGCDHRSLVGKNTLSFTLLNGILLTQLYFAHVYLGRPLETYNFLFGRKRPYGSAGWAAGFRPAHIDFELPQMFLWPLSAHSLIYQSTVILRTSPGTDCCPWKLTRVMLMQASLSFTTGKTKTWAIRAVKEQAEPKSRACSPKMGGLPVNFLSAPKCHHSTLLSAQL